MDYIRTLWQQVYYFNISAAWDSLHSLKDNNISESFQCTAKDEPEKENFSKLDCMCVGRYFKGPKLPSITKDFLISLSSPFQSLPESKPSSEYFNIDPPKFEIIHALTVTTRKQIPIIDSSPLPRKYILSSALHSVILSKNLPSESFKGICSGSPHIFEPISITYIDPAKNAKLYSINAKPMIVYTSNLLSAFKKQIVFEDFQFFYEGMIALPKISRSNKYKLLIPPSAHLQFTNVSPFVIEYPKYYFLDQFSPIVVENFKSPRKIGIYLKDLAGRITPSSTPLSMIVDVPSTKQTSSPKLEVEKVKVEKELKDSSLIHVFMKARKRKFVEENCNNDDQLNIEQHSNGNLQAIDGKKQAKQHLSEDICMALDVSSTIRPEEQQRFLVAFPQGLSHIRLMTALFALNVDIIEHDDMKPPSLFFLLSPTSGAIVWNIAQFAAASQNPPPDENSSSMKLFDDAINELLSRILTREDMSFITIIFEMYNPQTCTARPLTKVGLQCIYQLELVLAACMMTINKKVECMYSDSVERTAYQLRSLAMTEKPAADPNNLAFVASLPFMNILSDLSLLDHSLSYKQ